MATHDFEILPLEPVIPIRRARYWVQAVEYQARRVIATHAAPFDLHAPLHMEEQFLLTAAQKANRWLQKALEVTGLPPEVANRIEIFLRAISVAYDMRNFREHDDEYDLGKGRERQKLDMVVDVAERRVKMGHRISVTYRDDVASVGDKNDINGLHLLLGGRFDVVVAISEASALAAYLVAQENLDLMRNPVTNPFVGPPFPVVAETSGGE